MRLDIKRDKALFLSTIEAFFSGKKELFEGLYVYNQEWVWQGYPIMHLDLNTGKYDSVEALDGMPMPSQAMNESYTK